MIAEAEAQKARADYLARDAAGAALHAARARALAPPAGDKWTRLVVLLLLVSATDDYQQARRDSEEALSLAPNWATSYRRDGRPPTSPTTHWSPVISRPRGKAMSRWGCTRAVKDQPSSKR